MTLRRVVMVRHGQTDFNAEGRMQGHMESELTEEGVAQARRAARLLVRYRPVRLLSSDLSRAVRTAGEIGLTTGLAVELDERLRETNLGKWQGFTPAEVELDWPGAIQAWRSDPTFAPPGGESRVDVANRAIPVVDELARAFDDTPEPQTALLCAHGGLISSLTCSLIGLQQNSWTAIGGLNNARWAVLRRRSGPAAPWRLTGYDVGQLDDTSP